MSDVEPEVIDVDVVEVVPGTTLEVRPQNTAMILQAETPRDFISRSQEIAEALLEVVEQRGLKKRIGNNDHLYVEAWTFLGSMMGAFGQSVFAVEDWTREYRDPETGKVIGWEARVEARTADGQVVGAAESMCTRKESKWKSADDYAIRSMAQTRATSKALRQPLGFLVELAGFSATPSEEMDESMAGRGRSGQQQQQQQEPPKPASAQNIQKLRDKLADYRDYPEWEEEAVVAQARRIFQRPIEKLDDLTTHEVREIVKALNAWSPPQDEPGYNG